GAEFFQHVTQGERFERAAQLEGVVLEEKAPAAGKIEFVGVKDFRFEIERRHVARRTIDETGVGFRARVVPEKTFRHYGCAGAVVACRYGEKRGLSVEFSHGGKRAARRVYGLRVCICGAFVVKSRSAPFMVIAAPRGGPIIKAAAGIYQRTRHGRIKVDNLVYNGPHMKAPPERGGR